MPVIDELKSNIRSKLSTIRENFLRKSNGTYILENCISINGANTEFGKSVLNNIIDYQSFYNSGVLSSPQITSGSDFNRIKVLSSTGIYSDGTQTTFQDVNITTTGLNTNKFNLTNFYTQNTQNLLNAFVQNYNLLRDNWVVFKSGLSVGVKGYTPATVLSPLSIDVRGYSTNSTLKTDFNLDTIVNDDGINLFAAQRMLLLMILITEIYTVMRLYQNYNGADSGIQTALTNLLLHKINILIEINSNSSSSNTDIESSYKNSYQKYKTSQTVINDTKDKLENIRLDLSNNKAYLDSQTSITRKMNMLSYFAYVFAAILLIAILVVLAVPLEQNRKRSSLIILFALIVLVGAIIYLMGRSIEQEGFVGNFTQLDQLPGYGSTTNVNSVSQDLIYPLIIQQIMIYLDDTIRLSNTISSTQVYNNVNASMAREAGYYKDTTGQLELGSVKADDMGKVFYLDTTVARSRISLVISLLVIIALTAILTLVFDTSPSIKKVIYTISGLLIALAIILYVLYTAPRVRTDAYKYYWGRPEKL